MTKNKIIFTIVILILSLSLAKAAEACRPLDWMYTLNIGNLDVNIEKLAELCTAETCEFTENFITIRSHDDERMAVIIDKTPPTPGPNNITIRLPYQLSNPETLPMLISEVDYKTHDWQETTSQELGFLKKAGVLEIEDSEIKEISTLAAYGKNILYCGNEWRALGAGCTCEAGKEQCVFCEGGPVIAAFLPQKLLTLEALIEGPEEKEEQTEVLAEKEETPTEEKTETPAGGPKETKINQKYLYFVPSIIILGMIAWLVLSKRKKNN